MATGSPAGVFAVGAIALLTVVAGLVVRSPRAGAALSAAALVPITAALALAVPGHFGTPQVTLAAAGVAAWSLISLILPHRESRGIISFFTATTVLGVGVLLVAGASALWQLPLVTLGAGLLVVALLFTVEAPQLSALWARFPLPVIPAPGDPTPSAPSARVLEDLPRRVRISDAHQTGFIAGAVLLSVIGSLAIAWRPETLSPWGWYVVAATAAAAALRARVWDSAAIKAWLLAQPPPGRRGVGGPLHRDGALPDRTGDRGGARCAGVGLGCRRAEPGYRFAGDLLAAAASAGGIRRVRNRRVADPGDRVPGGAVRGGA